MIYFNLDKLQLTFITTDTLSIEVKFSWQNFWFEEVIHIGLASEVVVI